ncbi:MAG: hypothetical protein OXE59_12830 [Bacteroidetes bacterium]|nr:hypothetical protein [Bacteroidota bacterium]
MSIKIIELALYQYVRRMEGGVQRSDVAHAGLTEFRSPPTMNEDHERTV